LVWIDAFEGIDADVVLVWEHQRFSQDVLIRECPQLPADWDGEAVRLEIVTELMVDVEPTVQAQRVQLADGMQADDHAVIDFGALAMIMGTAFEAQDGLVLGGLQRDGDGTVVLKQWQRREDGRAFVVESVSWLEAWPYLRELPAASQAHVAGSSSRGITLARKWPPTPPRQSETEPVEMASIPYRPEGYAVDFVIIPDSGTPTTLASGQTYYIRTSYYSGSSVTFEPGCTIKFKDNANLLLYGPISFPDTLQTPVFTSRNDDGFGEKIEGVAGEADSNGDPSLHRARQAVWVYYVGFDTTIRNARVRWARTGIQSDVNAGVYVSHTLQNSLIEQTDIGVYANLQNATLTLSSVKKHAVTTAISLAGPGGTVYGSMMEAKFYTDKSFEGVTGVWWDDGLWVPDTMGAVGPNHFVEHLNGKIAVFNKLTSERTSEALPDQFFKLANELRIPFDPRIAYDHGSARWVDANGIYLSASHFHWVGTAAVNDGNTVVAIRKPAVYQGTLQATYLFNSISDIDTWAIQPAVNFDTSPLGGYAWFVAKGPSQGAPYTYQAGRLKSRKLSWGTNGAEWKSSWMELSSPSSYLTYFDLDRGSVSAPQKGTSSRIDLARTGSRLMMALIKNGSLWTCQHVGLDGTDGDYDGGDTGSSVDRSAIQWIKLQLYSSNPPAYSTHGRIYSSAASNPYWYYMPSLAVNNAGHMLCGFSGSRTSEYIGAFWYGRLANGTFPEPLTIVQSGRKPTSAEIGTLWGDYSHTTLDPNGTTFWTVQEYAGYHQDEGPFWSTWISSIIVAP
jgi:hypothetical protein